MGRGPSGNADKLSAPIAEIEAEAYARGRADARKELLDLLGAGTAGRGAARRARAKPAKPAAPKRRASGRKRAPNGSVPRFVGQALRDRPVQTPQEVLARAANDMKRLIKLPPIRAELRNGRQQGKYELNEGRWSLAVRARERGRADARELSFVRQEGCAEGRFRAEPVVGQAGEILSERKEYAPHFKRNPWLAKTLNTLCAGLDRTLRNERAEWDRIRNERVERERQQDLDGSQDQGFS